MHFPYSFGNTLLGHPAYRALTGWTVDRGDRGHHLLDGRLTPYMLITKPILNNAHFRSSSSDKGQRRPATYAQARSRRTYATARTRRTYGPPLFYQGRDSRGVRSTRTPGTIRTPRTTSQPRTINFPGSEEFVWRSQPLGQRLMSFCFFKPFVILICVVVWTGLFIIFLFFVCQEMFQDCWSVTYFFMTYFNL